MVVWIIGLSGAGKTTLSESVVAAARGRGAPVAMVDGDVVREMFGNDLGHTLEDRRRNADRICRLCKFLDDQGIHVVCAILSLFPETRAWNRANIANYFEVFIDTPLEDMVARDVKGIYGRFKRGEIANVAGMDIPFPEPADAEIRIRNDGSRDSLLAWTGPIVDRLLGGRKS